MLNNMKINSYSLQGLRETNEDQHVYFINLDGEEKTLILWVYLMVMEER